MCRCPANSPSQGLCQWPAPTADSEERCEQRDMEEPGVPARLLGTSQSGPTNRWTLDWLQIWLTGLETQCYQGLQRWMDSGAQIPLHPGLIIIRDAGSGGLSPALKLAPSTLWAPAQTKCSHGLWVGRYQVSGLLNHTCSLIFFFYFFVYYLSLSLVELSSQEFICVVICTSSTYNSTWQVVGAQ